MDKIEEEHNRSKKAELVNLEASTKSLREEEEKERAKQFREGQAQTQQLQRLQTAYDAEKKRLKELDRSGKL